MLAANTLPGSVVYGVAFFALPSLPASPQKAPRALPERSQSTPRPLPDYSQTTARLGLGTRSRRPGRRYGHSQSLPRRPQILPDPRLILPHSGDRLGTRSRRPGRRYGHSRSADCGTKTRRNAYLCTMVDGRTSTTPGAHEITRSELPVRREGAKGQTPSNDQFESSTFKVRR